MLEDEFDFAGQNPARHLPLDRKAIPFDYESRLQQQGYTKESPPDIGGLFKALASEYVPTRVVHLPPKVVTRIHIRDRFAGLFFSFLFYYLPLVGLLGIAIPYANFSSYEAKVHLQPGATCTVTSMHVESLEDSDNNVYYSPVVKFTLRTPDGKSYQAYEYWPGSYNQQADAQQYISRFQINQSYPCWYDSMNPAEASFFKVDVDFWDHFWLLVSAVLFLACGVLPNMLIVCVMGLFLIDLVHRRIELAW